MVMADMTLPRQTNQAPIYSQPSNRKSWWQCSFMVTTGTTLLFAPSKRVKHEVILVGKRRRLHELPPILWSHIDRIRREFGMDGLR